MDSHKKADNLTASKSPQSERFWLTSANDNEDPFVLSLCGDSTARLDEELPAENSALARCGSPEDSNLRVDDDAPLCSVCETLNFFACLQYMRMLD